MAPLIRAGAVAGLSFLGLSIDEPANLAATGDTEITPAGAAGGRVLVITAREDLEIACQARKVCAS